VNTELEPGRISRENIIEFLEKAAKLLSDPQPVENSWLFIPNFMRLAIGDKRQRRRFWRNAARRARP